MKKIIAILLALSCIFALASCKGNATKNAIENIEEMYKSCAPTKIVTTTTNTVEKDVFRGEYVLVTGKVGNKLATTLTYWYERLRSVEDGSTPVIVDKIEKVEGTREWLEDQGIRENGGFWLEGLNFAPTAGSLAVNLDADNLIEPKYENNTLSFSVAPENAAKVLGAVIGEGLDGATLAGNVSITITHVENFISGITVSYTIDGGENYPDTAVVISSVYTYDIEKITISK